MTAKRNTVIFDLDGTLLNTLDDLADSVNHIMEVYGFPLHTTDRVRQMVGNGIYVLFEKAVPGGRENPAYESCVKDFQVYYAAHMRVKTGPFPGILELLARLKAEGYHLAVVSNKFDAAVKELCRDFFGDTIEVAIGESATVARKPAPDTVFAAMDQLGVKPENCVYVGDSDVDIETAKNSGIPCLSVSWGFRDKAFLLAHSAAFIAADTQELLRGIHSL